MHRGIEVSSQHIHILTVEDCSKSVSDEGLKWALNSFELYKSAERDGTFSKMLQNSTNNPRYYPKSMEESESVF